MVKRGNKNRGKLIFGVIFSIFIFAFLSSFISAQVVNITIPVSGSTISGTVNVNVTNISAFNNMRNCTIYLKSSSTANSSWTSVGTFLNNTDSIVNGTFNSATFEDSNDYIINATCRNSTNDIAFYTNTGLIINNTTPTAPTLSPASNTVLSSSSTQTFTGTVLDNLTTSCTYTIYRDGSSTDSKSSSGSTTYSGSSCTFTKTFSSSTDNGNYYWTITASDGSDSKKSTTNLISVQIPGSSGGLPPGTYTTEDGKTLSIGSEGEVTSPISGWIIGGIIFIVIIVAIAFVVRKK